MNNYVCVWLENNQELQNQQQKNPKTNDIKKYVHEYGSND